MYAQRQYMRASLADNLNLMQVEVFCHSSAVNARIRLAVKKMAEYWPTGQAGVEELLNESRQRIGIKIRRKRKKAETDEFAASGVPDYEFD